MTARKLAKHIILTRLQKWGLLLFIVGVLLLPLFLLLKPVEANWFNDLWRYRQKLTVGTVTTELTDYQIQIVGLDTQTLFNAGKLQANCQDLRFTDLQGNILDYWIEDDGVGCSTDTTTDIWVRVPKIYTTGTTLYMYYGNPGAVAYQSGNRTFEFFDDFEIGTLSTSLWSTTGTPSITGGNLVINNNAGIQSVAQFGQGRRFITRASQSNTALNLGRLGFSNRAFGTGYTADDSASFLFDSSTGGNFENDQTNEGVATTGTGTVAENTSMNDLEIGWGTTASVFLINGTQNSSITTNIPNESSYVRIENTDVTNSLTLQWVAVTKFADSTPASPTVSAEEISQGPLIYYKIGDKDNQIIYNHGSLQGRNLYLGTNNTVETADPIYLSDECVLEERCLYFDGVNDLSTMTSGTDVRSIVSNNFTMSIWVNPKSTRNSTAQGTSGITGTSGQRYAIYPTYSGVTSARGLGISVGTNGVSVFEHGPSNLPSLLVHNETISGWTNIIVTVQNKVPRLYINGVLKKTGLQSATTTLFPGEIFSESITNYGRYHGFLSDYRMYNRVISEAEIQKLATNDSPGTAIGKRQINNTVNNLVAWWKMDEYINTSALVDSSGSNLTATVGNSPAVSGGKYGNSRTFNGSNTYATITSSLLNSPSQFAVSTWIYSSSFNQNGGIFERATSAAIDTQYSCFFQSSPNQLVFRTISSTIPYDLTVDVSTSGLTVNQWNHIVCTYDGTTKKIFINGQEKASQNIVHTIDSGASGAMNIGARIGGVHLNGRLDDFRFYNKGLTSDDVVKLYNFAPSPVLHLKFDETTGLTAADSSVNSFNATLTNFEDSDWGNGQSGNALTFDGVDESGAIADSDVLDIRGDMSFSVWVKPGSTQVQYATIFGKHSSSSLTGYTLEQNNNITNQYYFTWLSGSGATCNSTNNFVLTPNVWQHLAAIKSGNISKIYINGLLKTQCTGSFSDISINTASFGVGRYGTTAERYWNGTMDDLKIYNYAISESSILQDSKVEQTVTSNSLQGYWKFDNGTGTTLTDSSSNARNGTLSGGPTWKSGYLDQTPNYSVDLDGTDDYISIPSIVLGNDFTLSAWVYPEATINGARIIDRWAGTAPTRGWFMSAPASSSQITCGVSWDGTNSASATSTTSLPLNQWTHVICRRVGTKIQVYINGTLENEATTGTGTNNPSTTVAFGRQVNGGANFNGRIDEVKIWNTAITETQVTQDYQYGIKSIHVNVENKVSTLPTLYYKFDEKSGATTRDSSDNSLSGTLTNMDPATDWTTRGKIGGALDMDGVDDYVITPDNNLLDASSAISISMWVKPRSFANSPFLLLKTNASYTEIYKVGFNISGTVDWRINGNDISSTKAAILNEWNHILVTFNGTQKKTYLNGELVAVESQSATITNGDGALYLGVDIDSVSDFNQQFNGIIDNVKIWSNIALTAREAAIEYNGGGPLAYYKVDDGEGTRVADHSGKGYHLTMNNMDPSNDWIIGKKNSALNFDGVNDYAGSSSIIAGFDNQATISFWARKNGAWANDYQKLFITGTSSTSLGIYVSEGPVSVGRFYVGFCNTGGTCATTISPTYPPQNEWFHVVGIYNGTNTFLYINGELKAQNNLTGSLREPTGIRMGWGYATEYFNGDIDEVKIYNYAFTADDIKREYNLGSVLRFE
jgi:hypothetical protein